MIDRRASGAARLLLVRHGEVEEWARGRIYGRLDPSLSPHGLAQAGALASACALAPEVDARLREIEFGALEGLTFAEAEEREPATWREWMERIEVAFGSLTVVRQKLFGWMVEAVSVRP